jgi:hypothetical protein
MSPVSSLNGNIADLDLQDLDKAEIKVILGSDATEIIIPREVREGPKGSPYGIKTKLGWTITGKIPEYVRKSESVYFVHVASSEEELNEMVKSWWKTESFGCLFDRDEQRSREDERVIKLLDDTTQFVDGRYEVGLIWKDPNVNLPNNKVVAERRLRSLERRLHHDPLLSIKYRQTINNDIEKGHVQKLSEQELSTPVARQWYLPHHPVIHPNKPGKVRRVSDAAAKYQGTSLNEHLLAGSDLLNYLV